jgi:hypothetical protein
MAQINAVERARLASLMAVVTTHGVKYLTADEHKELRHLLQIAGLISDTPSESVPGQPISGRSALRQLDELRAGWLTPQQKIVDLWEQKITFDMTPHQRAVWKMRPAS